MPKAEDGSAASSTSAPAADAAAADVMARMAASDPAFTAIVEVQEAALHLAREGLSLRAVHPGPPPPGLHASVSDGTLHIVSADGASATQAAAFQGGGLRWLSASTVASASQSFAATRLLGFVGAGSEAPHLSLGHKLEGGRVSCVWAGSGQRAMAGCRLEFAGTGGCASWLIALTPAPLQVQVTAALMHRRTPLLNKDYFRRFYCAGGPALRCESCLLYSLL